MAQDNYELQRLSNENAMDRESSNSEDYSSADIEQDIFRSMEAIPPVNPMFISLFEEDSEYAKKVAAHKIWLQNIRHERPNTAKPYKVGIYIRYFNQTRYTNYISYHKKQFRDSVALCPKWTLVDFYIDEGSTAPNMESSPAWSRLVCDCMEGKIDLIITQKISSVSRKPHEIAICSRILAAQNPPIGIYFISEDVFTLASYYQQDLRDEYFLQTDEMSTLPPHEDELRESP